MYIAWFIQIPPTPAKAVAQDLKWSNLPSWESTAVHLLYLKKNKIKNGLANFPVFLLELTVFHTDTKMIKALPTK